MANKFWVGGTGTWTSVNTANWSNSTGGASGASVPTASDYAIFDSLSGTGTATISNTAVALSYVIDSSTLNVVLGANRTINGPLIISKGNFDFNNNTLTCQYLTGTNSNVRNLAFGTGQLILTIGNAGAFVIDMANATNFTYTGTSNIVSNYSGALGTRTFQFGSASGATEANVMNLTVSAGSDANTVIGSFKTLDFTGYSGACNFSNTGIYKDLIISTGMTTTNSAGTVGFYAASDLQKITTNGKTFNALLLVSGTTNTLQLQDNLTLGSTKTLTLTSGTLDVNTKTLSTGLFVGTGTSTRVIAFGAGNITTTGSGTVWNTSSTTGFSYTGTPTVNISNNSATATTVSTGSMTAAQALNFNYTIGTYTLTDSNAVYKTVNFTGFTGTLSNSARTIYGGATFVAGMTLTAGANATTFAATSGTNNITTAAKTLDFPITFFGLGGTFAFQDALTQGSTRAFTFTAGTVQLKASATTTTGAFATSGSSQKFLQSTTPGTQATLSQASGTVDASYLTIQDINATGNATWLAYTDQSNTDAGNVDGWDFGISPVVGGAEYTYTLRSFTQPRRF